MYEQPSTVLCEMMDARLDFPSSGHLLTKWFGVSRCMLLECPRVANADAAHSAHLLSTIAIAAANVQWYVLQVI